MREIKFRAWDKGAYSNKMIYDIQNEFEERINLGMDSFGHYLNKDSFEVMQYTGLKDCKGKEIYEGDILQVDKKYSGDFQPIITVFHNGCFKGQAYHKLTEPFILNTPITTSEVIGNIYENPELLK